jgi:hypothetical protein
MIPGIRRKRPIATKTPKKMIRNKAGLRLPGVTVVSSPFWRKETGSPWNRGPRKRKIKTEMKPSQKRPKKILPIEGPIGDLRRLLTENSFDSEPIFISISSGN